ncbi:NAD(P)-binding protein [Coniochaeta ligniaria NRRL 30616]|uniref:NAD(P)-binding protein n=1 Tax=Coniochaeta ligniaria NRRL 30616 TaxID=1408157 RepID=A0A1J7I7G6_9PEZI|nr:NAD(P)-binding protein [Coniochaeta ligniaria NRRL 30616]
MSIHKVAVFGASGNFGTPITAALAAAGFDVTAISRLDSTSVFPPGLRVARVAYTLPDLSQALEGQDAAVCVVGPGGMHLQSTMVDAAAAAGVRRFIVDDFGWGRESRSFPEFGEIHRGRTRGWDRARERADGEGEGGFSWTGISTGNPVDWALRRFPMMGFDVVKREAVIYDSGTEEFSGTTLEGIGQAVVGVLSHPEETRNRFVRVMSVKTCQNELLEAFEGVTGVKWEVRRDTTGRLLESGREKNREGRPGWVLELVVTQLFQEGEGRGLVARTREETDSDLLGVREESVRDVAIKALGL